jgi:hypothetical protein
MDHYNLTKLYLLMLELETKSDGWYARLSKKEEYTYREGELALRGEDDVRTVALGIPSIWD